jgi:hypothetical protein
MGDRRLAAMSALPIRRPPMHGIDCRLAGCYCQKAKILMYWRSGIEWKIFARARGNIRSQARIQAFMQVFCPHPGARA